MPMDFRWVFDKNVRDSLGEDTLPAWKAWLKEKNVVFMPFLDEYYPGDLQADISGLKLKKIDEWLFEFLHTDDGLEAAQEITPAHPEFAASEEYDPLEAMAQAGPVQIGNVVVGVKPTQPVIMGAPPAQPPLVNQFKHKPGTKATFGKGIRVAALDQYSSVGVYDKAAWLADLQYEYDGSVPNMSSKDLSKGSKILVFDPEGGTVETLIELKEDTKISCFGFGCGLSSDHWLVLDDGGSEVIVIGDEPIDISDDDDGSDLNDEFDILNVIGKKAHYHAQYAFYHM